MRIRPRLAGRRRVALWFAACALGAPGAASAQEGARPEAGAPAAGTATAQSRLWQAAETVVESPYHRLSLDMRQRIEVAKQDDLQRSEAYTLRTRLGLGTQPWQGFSVFGELENVVSYHDGSYFNTTEKPNGQTPIPDPEETELNRLFASLERPDWWDSRALVGRQRIELDDQRFVGSRPWRQNEQTFDGVLAQSSFGLEELTFTYAYIRRTRRPFGRDGPVTSKDYGGASHLVHARWIPGEGFALTGFAYLLALHLDGGPDPSSQSYGLRAEFEPEIDVDLHAQSLLSFALQKEYGGRRNSYETFYLHLAQGLRHAEYGRGLVGIEWLGSDDGTQVFETPLASFHRNNGWADAFGDNGGPDGLRDLYVEVAPRLPFELVGRVVYHHFWSDDRDKTLGNEIDVELIRRVGEHLEARAQMGWFDSKDNERQSVWRVSWMVTLRI